MVCEVRIADQGGWQLTGGGVKVALGPSPPLSARPSRCKPTALLALSYSSSHFSWAGDVRGRGPGFCLPEGFAAQGP